MTISPSFIRSELQVAFDSTPVTLRQIPTVRSFVVKMFRSLICWVACYSFVLILRMRKSKKTTIVCWLLYLCRGATLDPSILLRPLHGRTGISIMRLLPRLVLPDWSETSSSFTRPRTKSSLTVCKGPAWMEKMTWTRLIGMEKMKMARTWSLMTMTMRTSAWSSIPLTLRQICKTRPRLNKSNLLLSTWILVFMCKKLSMLALTTNTLTTRQTHNWGGDQMMYEKKKKKKKRPLYFSLTYLLVGLNRFWSKSPKSQTERPGLGRGSNHMYIYLGGLVWTLRFKRWWRNSH